MDLLVDIMKGDYETTNNEKNARVVAQLDVEEMRDLFTLAGLLR